ncbi:hypothetical protein GCM10028781_14190 [Nostocoides australiense]
MAAEAQGRVDDDAARLAHGGGQHLDDAFEQDGHVPVVGGCAPVHAGHHFGSVRVVRWVCRWSA